MSDDKKKYIIEFIDSLGIEKPGDLYLKIYGHIREHGKEPRRLHGGAGTRAAENPQSGE